jgi:hypothetical protein
MILNTQTLSQVLSTGQVFFSYPNKIQQASDLVINGIDLSGNLSPFVFQSGAVFLNAALGITATVGSIDVDTGASITLSGPLATNWLLDARSNIPETQPTSIKNQGPFLPDLHEEAFDRITRQVQDLNRKTYLFGVHGPDTETVPWPALPGPAARANMLSAFDGNGLPTVVPPSSGGGGGGGGGTGAPGVNAIVITVSAPALQVPATSAGVVTDFSLAIGQASLYSGVTNLTPLAVWSIIQQVNCTAAITTNTGVYNFSALTQNVGLITIQALYQSQLYTIQVTISKVIPGAAGTPGTPGTPGAPGAPATPGLSLVLSNAAAVVLAYANGGVPSFAGIAGEAFLLSGGTDVSSATAWSVTPTNCTGTINTAANTPVVGQPVGYYQVTAMTAPVGLLTINGVFSGSTLTAVFTVSQVPTGFQIVSTLPAIPSAQSFLGNVVFLTTDQQLYRFNGTAWVVSVPATAVTGLLTAAQIASIATAQLTGQITTGQITPSAITTPLLAAAAVTSAQIAAGTIVAGNIAASTITGTQIAASTIVASNIAASAITTNLLAAGAVTAAKIGVTSLSAIAANIGTITAGTLSNSGGSALIDLNNSFIEFNNGVRMIVRGLGFGVASNYLEWFGPTQSSASNFVACTDALGIYWLKTDGTFKFGTSTQASATTKFTGPSTNTVTIPGGKQQMILELFADTGLGGHGNGTDPGGGGGSGGGCKSIYNVSAAAGQTVTVVLQQGNSQPTASTITSGSFAITTMSAVGGTGGAVGAFGVPGVGGSASGGNIFNLPGLTGGDAISTQAGGIGLVGTYGSGNSGAGGAISATTNRAGLPALCYVTFL